MLSSLLNIFFRFQADRFNRRSQGLLGRDSEVYEVLVSRPIDSIGVRKIPKPASTTMVRFRFQADRINRRSQEVFFDVPDDVAHVSRPIDSIGVRKFETAEIRVRARCVSMPIDSIGVRKRVQFIWLGCMGSGVSRPIDSIGVRKGPPVIMPLKRL